LLVGVMPSAASEQNAQGSTDDATSVTVPLTLVGYDSEIAARNGFRIVTDPDGRQRSIPVTAAARRAMAEHAISSPVTGQSPGTLGTVIGDCGTATLDATALGSRRSTIVTGFTVKVPAYSFRWSIAVTDPGGSFTKTWGPAALASRTSWAASYTWTAGARGSAFGQVRTGFYISYAALINGGWCTAGPASDAWRIT
jgi:hypothetical protein